MNTFTLAGHVIEFADCHELGQGGPDTCTMSIDGEPVVSRLVRLSSFLWGHLPTPRFHPSPLEFDGDILVPIWGRPNFYLVRINPRSMKIKRLTWRGNGYMRLLKVIGNEVEFSTWHDARRKRRVRLR